MLAARIQGATRVLGAPADWDETKAGVCGGLPVLDLPGEGGGPHRMVSAWEPLPEEIDAIKAGGPVLLFITGAAHPVVALAVQDPASGRLIDDGPPLREVLATIQAQPWAGAVMVGTPEGSMNLWHFIKQALDPVE